MALATQCPHCHTTFRVAHDQLKLRAGLVRCGACKQIFNGIEHLLRPMEADQTVAVPEPKPQPVQAAEQTVPPAAEELGDSQAETSPEPAVSEPDTEGPKPSEVDYPASRPLHPPTGTVFHVDEQADVDPLTRMTLMDVASMDERHDGAGSLPDDGTTEAKPAKNDTAELPDPLEAVIEELQRKPLRGTAKPAKSKQPAEPDDDPLSEFDEPSFVRQGRRRERFGRAARAFMGVGSCILLVGLLAQSTYIFRNEIAAWFPPAKPLLDDACGALQCQVGLPAQIEAVSVESSELQVLTSEKNIFGLTTLLRNDSGTEQAWPSIELTLNDTNERAIARRVFSPTDYLRSPKELASGIAPKSERPVRLLFELSQLKASGYRVYLFYP